MSNNEILKTHLDKYLLSGSENYATAIVGSWGSGKTHFIIDYMKNAAGTKPYPEHEFLYVSLYGLNKTNDISNALWAKSGVFLNETARKQKEKFLKFISSINVMGNSIDFSVLNSMEYGEDQQHILIFDDLERSTINMETLLGYINKFVEHGNQSVIIIVAEDKIKKEQEASYYTMKEKIVRKSFKFECSISEMYDVIIEQDNLSKNLEFLKDIKPSIIGLLESGNITNLRVLQHGLIDFNDFFDNIEEKYKTEDNAQSLRKLCQVFFLHNFGFRLGWLKESEFDNLKNHALKSMGFPTDIDNDSKMLKLTKYLYETCNIYDFMLPASFWKAVIINNDISEKNLKLNLTKSKNLIHHHSLLGKLYGILLI